MKTINAFIVEDEVKNIEILREILEKYCEGVTVTGTARSVEEAAERIPHTEIDVLFLDIEMPPHKGFELLEMLPDIDFDVVFITAHQEYALQAIKFAALDYLLKPINIQEVKAALQKVQPHKQGNMNELAGILKDYLRNNGKSFTKIVIPVNDGYNVIDLNDIVYCEACDSYTKIQLVAGTTHLISK